MPWVTECRDLARGRLLAGRVTRADSALARARGLLGRDSLHRDEGLWLLPCRQVHTFFMRFAIDVVFLDRGLRVVRVCPALAPWRLSPWVARAASALELAAGTAAGLGPGDRLGFAPKEEPA